MKKKNTSISNQDNLPNHLRPFYEYLEVNLVSGQSLEEEANTVASFPNGVELYTELFDYLKKDTSEFFVNNFVSAEHGHLLSELQVAIKNNPDKLDQELLNAFQESQSDLGFKELDAANLCAFVGIDNAIEANIEKFTSNFFDDKRYIEVIKLVTEITSKSNNAQDAGKRGAAKRWLPRDRTKAFAIELSQKTIYKNDNQAAAMIVQEVLEYGKEVGFYFTDIFQAKERIYRWLREHRKASMDE